LPLKMATKMIISFCFTEVNFFFYFPLKENFIISIA
jgi:hypothetical protein